jgi:hypothetical protein
MEAAGVYWKPVWRILSDGDFAMTLANAAHVKNVPGRKTDVNDATWLAALLAHGLVRGSFVPDTQTQDLLRTRKQLVRKRTSHVQRLQKTLEDANIKLEACLCPHLRERSPSRPQHVGVDVNPKLGSLGCPLGQSARSCQATAGRPAPRRTRTATCCQPSASAVLILRPDPGYARCRSSL